MRFIICVLLGLCINAVYAVDIEGIVTVMKKGGKRPLKDFSNTLVYVSGIQTQSPTDVVVMMQYQKAFQPRLLPIIKGQSVRFLNNDEVQHNVFSTDAKFDLGRYPKGQDKVVTFSEAGRFKVYCNIHQRMISDLVVLENTYFAVTGKDGRYRIANAPVGQYQLHAWHIYGGEAVYDVDLTASSIIKKDMTLISKKVVRDVTQHKNKKGRHYQRYFGDDDYDY